MATENLRKRFDQMLVNLSDNLFSKSKFSLLNENLSFSPRPNKYNKQNLNKDLVKFYRNIKLKAHFGSTEIIQINLDLKAVATAYQINYPAMLKSS